MARFMDSAEYAMRQAMARHLVRPAKTTRRLYARAEPGLRRWWPRANGTLPDRLSFPVLISHAQPDDRARSASGLGATGLRHQGLHNLGFPRRTSDSLTNTHLPAFRTWLLRQLVEILDKGHHRAIEALYVRACRLDDVILIGRVSAAAVAETEVTGR